MLDQPIIIVAAVLLALLAFWVVFRPRPTRTSHDTITPAKLLNTVAQTPVAPHIDVEALLALLRQPSRSPPAWERSPEFREFSATLGTVLKSRLAHSAVSKVATYAEISLPTLTKALGGSNPTLFSLWRICKAMGCRVSDVLAEVDRTAGAPDAGNSGPEL